MKKQLSLAVVFLLMFAFTAAFNMHAAKASPTVIIVPDQYSTIQAAIDHANDGDTVFVRSGTYYEHIIVNKSVALVGENKDTTLIDGSYSGIVVNVTGNGVNVSGFTIQHSGNSWNIGGPPYAAGIFLSGASDCNLDGNRIVSNRGIGVQAEYGASNNVVAENIISNNGVGIATLNASSNSFKGNIVTGNGRGFGLNVNSDFNVISENVITASEWVIAVHACHYNILTDNYIANGQIGIYLPDSSHNRVCHNYVVNNLQQASLEGFPSHFNYWDDGYPSGGNYWSDYSGADGNGDGIGDTAYTIDANNVDRYPQMHSEVIVPYHFATIQEAIDHANNGDKVFVKAGVYNEHVVVNKTVSLMGEDSKTTVVDGNFSSHVINVVCDYVQVTGFTVRNCGNLTWDAALNVNASYCRIFGNVVEPSGFFGISLYGSTNSEVRENNVTGPAEFGITLANSSHNVVAHNDIGSSSCGVGFHAESHNNTLSENSVHDCGDSIIFHAAQDNVISWNILGNNSRGIWLQESEAAANATVKSNMIDSCGEYGILVYQTSYNGIYANNISRNEVGIDVQDERSNNNVISQNSLESNHYGVRLYGNPVNNRLYCNNFLNNTVQAYLGASSYFNNWDNGYPSGGNYWSDYSGQDLFCGPYQNETGSDGIGDASYNIGPSNLDHYPLMEPHVVKSMVGDVNGDLVVDIFDAILLSNAYNSNPSSSKWNPNADFNGDKTVDLFDAILLAGAFGKKYT